jgi:Tfp pilus assembly protein PilF
MPLLLPYPRIVTAKTRRAVWYGVNVTLLLLLASGGCKSLSKQPVAENVVHSRQMSLQALEALQHKRYDDAELLFAKAIETCPVDERARYHYADLLWRRGDHEGAIKQMSEAARLSAGEPSVVVNLGQMYLARGDAQRARLQAERAVQADRNNPQAWALLGDTQRAAGVLDDALASYHRALSLQEVFPHVQISVAEVYRLQHKPQRALATLAALQDRYRADQVPAELLVQEGLALRDLGRHGDAAQVFATAINRGSQLAETYYQLALAQAETGDFINARLSVTAGLELSPQHVPSQRLRDELFQAGGPLHSRAPSMNERR